MGTYNAHVFLPFFSEILQVEIEKRLSAKNIPVSSGQARLGLQGRTILEPSARPFGEAQLVLVLGRLRTFGRVYWQFPCENFLYLDSMLLHS